MRQSLLNHAFGVREGTSIGRRITGKGGRSFIYASKRGSASARDADVVRRGGEEAGSAILEKLREQLQEPLRFNEPLSVAYYGSAIAALEHDMAVDALKTNHGNIAKAARQLGTTERIMRYRFNQYALHLGRFSDPIPSKRGM